MPRIYKTKPDAKSDKVTIPMSPDLKQRLKNYAVSIGAAWTAAARELIEKGLGGGAK
jgi:hypothetical protein